MILYSGLITLEYNPATDILETTMPDASQFTLPEVRLCLDLIISHIRNYHISKALFDSRHTQLDMGEKEDEYKAMAAQFGKELMDTHIRKIARLALTDRNREEQGKKLQQVTKQTIDIGTFNNYKEALKWLEME
ncbi:hypothetical protein [Pontibacter fetidus]|uniref:STAS/SEC14 domain-containing protein n=1 Tax=Pontibacter fetidus TaxID=2700082 RepID=A0A6B2HB81_9BACT|nr:hypothetical protein [Pontibacter fetidus]NDK56824.1 hypothetical protein [Pontibacter fetidus]